MDDLWHVKGCQGLNRNSSQPSHLSASLNQFEMNPGQFGHPYVQQEVCVIERTIRQEPLGASLFNLGLQGPNIKSVRADVGNSLLALVPTSQHQFRPSHQPVAIPRSTFSSSSPQAYQLGSGSSPNVSSWAGHLSSMSGTRITSGGSGHGADSSLNMLGREVSLSVLGREVNLAQYSRMAAGQDCLESSLLRASGVEMLRQSGVHDNANDVSGQGPFPQWLTEIVNRRQRIQNMQSTPILASGGGFPRAAESSRDVMSGMGGLPPSAPSTTRGARVICANYDTGQRIGGELCLTQSGLFGVLCSCHDSHMSVAKFVQHVGIYSSNPGKVVVMDGSGESLVLWRRTFFSQFGVKVPEDNQGWDWSEEEVCESGPTKCKAVVTQSWQKEVDVSYTGEPVLKSRVTQVWDASLSPGTSADFHSPQSLTNMTLPSNLGEGALQDSRECFLKSFGRAFKGSSMEFGSCPADVENLQENGVRRQGSAEMLLGRNASQIGAPPPGEFFNFISGSQQFVSTQTEQQVAVERQIAVGSRSLLKALDLTWKDGQEPLPQEKDSALSSFELRLGQPSQQSQPAGASFSSALASQMQRVMMQRVLDTRRQKEMHGTNASGPHSFFGHSGRADESPVNHHHHHHHHHQNFERTSYMEPSRHDSSRVDPNRDVEGNEPVLVDHLSFKRMEDVSNGRFAESLRDRENMLNRDVGQFSTEGVRRWSNAGNGERNFKSGDGVLINPEHSPKLWENEIQRQIGGAVQSLSQGTQDLDTILGQEWMSRSRASQLQATELSDTLDGREGHSCRGGNMLHSQADCEPTCRDPCGEDKTQFDYGDMDASKGTRDRNGCFCTSCGNLTSAIMKERTVSKLGEHSEFCTKEAEPEGSQVEPYRQRMSRDTSQGPTSHDCNSPRVRRLRSFQALTSQGCSFGTNGMDEPPNQGSSVVSLAGGTPAVVEGDSGVDKRFCNSDRRVANSGLRESNNGTFQWKEMGGIFVPGNGTLADASAAHDELLPARARLEEDLLADTAAKANLGVAVNLEGSDKQHPVSDICSKSSENALSEFSDGTGAEEEVSTAQSIDKNPVESEVVDEGSGIGKCSSSDGVDMGLAPNLNLCSKDDDAQKLASPSSQGYPSFTNAKESPAAKVGTRSRAGYSTKEPAARNAEEKVNVETVKLDRKKRRTRKWKRLDAAIGAADAKRQKLSTPESMTEQVDTSQKSVQSSHVLKGLGNRSPVKPSPTMCGKVNTVKARKIIVTYGNRGSSHAEPVMESNVANGMDAVDTDDKYLMKEETLVMRVPQGLNRKKAKRSTRSKNSGKRSAADQQEGITPNKPASPDMTTVEAATIDTSSIKESVLTGSFVPESGALSTITVPKHIPILNVPAVKIGRVVLGRPSPRNATRMVSLNDIMNKPEGVTVTSPVDRLKAVAFKDSLKPSAADGGSKAVCPEEGWTASTPKDKVQASGLKDGLRACPAKDGLKPPSLKGGLKASSSKDGVAVSTPKESIQGLGPKERLKVKVCFPKDGLEGSSPKGDSVVSCAKNVIKLPLGRDGLKVSHSLESLKASSAKECRKISTPKDVPVISAPKNTSKEYAPKNGLRVPAVGDGSKVPILKEGWIASFSKDCSKSPALKNNRAPFSKHDMNGLTSTDVYKSMCPKDRLKLLTHKDAGNASALKNGLKETIVKERLKTVASKVASRDLFRTDMGYTSASKDGSNTSDFNDGFLSPVSVDNLKAPSKGKTEGTGEKGPRKLDSGLGIVALSQDNQDKKSFLAVKAWKESKNVSKSLKQEVRKVRSLHELITEKKLPGSGAEVFEFHDEAMESPGVLKQDSRGRTSKQPEPTFSVAVHVSESKCLVPRGERSPRGKLSKIKSMFWQKSNTGCSSGGTLAAEPVEIVVGRSFGQNSDLKVGSPQATEKVLLAESKFRSVMSSIRFPQKNKKKFESGDLTVQSARMVSSMIFAKELVNEKTVDNTRLQSQKRTVEQPEGMGSAHKKQRLHAVPVPPEPSSGVLKIIHPVPTSTYTPRELTLPPKLDTKQLVCSNHVVGLDVKKERKIKRQAMEEDPKLSGRKKRCQRSKWLDCKVPEGVVECCVCGSSVSEIFNQIVCCGRCPVKVHQGCYGVKKIPNSAWFCRTCKAAATHPICVLCGYGGGAMTRAQKANGFGKGLMKAWLDKINAKENADAHLAHSLTLQENWRHMEHRAADCQKLTDKHDVDGSIRGIQEEKGINDLPKSDSTMANHPGSIEKQIPEEWMASNTVTTGVVDPTVVQWVHMVCALWMPGTRCLNFGTMGVFDVSGVAQMRRKLICSICKRRGGACIQCRVVKCGIPFHAWCAHKKGLLQSEIVEDGSDQVGFFGKCLRHGKSGNVMNDPCDMTDTVRDVPGSLIGTSTCARTQGYEGKLTLEQKALYRRRATRNGAAAVSPEQVAAWLRINERKTCKARRFLKSSNSDQKTDHREYLRFKQEQGWRGLSVYKSGIHALGLYTAEFIGRGEMVVEYIGEIVGLRVADKREADYHSGKRMQYQGACYLFRIDRERIIDATRKGGIARFVNHSCSPNCVAKVICVKSQSKVVFFAQRDIYAGEEITYDYQFNFEQEGDKIPCFCGSATCRGTLN